MKRTKLVGVAAVLTAAAVAAIAAAAGTAGSTAQQARAGAAAAKPVTVLSLWGGSEKAAFQKVLAAFEKKTGIKTQYETARDFLPVIRTRLAAGNPPMVAIVPRPGVMADLAREGSLKPLAPMGLTPAVMNRNYSKAWVDLGTVDGKLYGVAGKANSKSVIWYRPDQFKKLGLKVPTTWAQLMAVTAKIKADGETPWAVGAKGGDSWTLTDWFENIYARTAGPAKYTQLFTGKLPFNDPSVLAAVKRMASIINDKYVAGGVEGALGTGFVDGIGRVFGTSADAQLYMEGGFVGGIALGDVNKALKPGVTIGSFPWPTINPSFGQPLVGGGDLAVAFADTPEVRKLIQFLASKQAGTIWVSTGAIVSPNKTVSPAAYPNVLVRAEAKQVASAKVFRFDGSDLLPGSLGGDWGATLQSVIKTPADAAKILGEFQKKAAQQFKK